eukprot:COSAG05_NODE_12_length_37297_cov_117.537072_30_plen_196_part_00
MFYKCAAVFWEASCGGAARRGCAGRPVRVRQSAPPLCTASASVGAAFRCPGAGEKVLISQRRSTMHGCHAPWRTSQRARGASRQAHAACSGSRSQAQPAVGGAAVGGATVGMAASRGLERQPAPTASAGIAWGASHWRVICVLYFAYFANIFGRTAVQVAIPVLQGDPALHFTHQMTASLLSLGAVAQVRGNTAQ